MALRLNGLQISLSLALILYAASTKATDSAIKLNVSYTYDPSAHSGHLVINCSLDASRTNMDTVATLTVLGSKPIGSQDEFDELAVVDMWSQEPRLSSKLEDAYVDVSGEIDAGNSSQSNVMLSWNSPISGYRPLYRCVANGLDSNGQAASVSATVQVELLSLGESCTKSVDTSDAELRVLSEKLENTAGAIDEVLHIVRLLSNKIGVLEMKQDEFQRNASFEFKLLAIDRNFDVTRVFRGRVYTVSKQKAVFNIKRANLDCKASGGYLLEIDDDEEYQFVYDFVEKIGGSSHFLTGGNDLDKEGTFVYYNSKKPVPHLNAWNVGQPDDYKNKEDCMEIRTNIPGINDCPCNYNERYICEVPQN